ncbi:type II secretion system minor pseudopilin GspK [Acinetobacter ursingii]|uniref:type II secretion system minor pseudopilin GspK n=1 Tax=Acinetobacter TaxID=469 RepID=UPI00124F1D24|nr:MULTISPECIES: type II secretion system minor pseudopilin GspK [Acinetobacter]MCU4357894.1 type II secretion system minor pseudopilin GspK [Acinetobacter ursingii]MDG9859323.1 type II secretion system minor pseudopilin GspK [Acinetobacter ursingii]MDG9893045.1 type II secretion system minor pseudopilin GspK [Acinetobacter ursingii]MDH0006522.1 type II secretion system minor pseudopilin GspK [Acinetobacter ursingii]MDH0478210.1 type II secretion system minor pseudopilin GspK [Acinetobacter ur
MMRSRIKNQQGIALITILVMVALATILAATIAKKQSNTAENTAYLIRQDQSLLYAKSAEAFFSELLVQDAQDSAQVDHLGETWAKPMPAFPVEGGYISGELQDESGKFNLNNLVKADGTPDENVQKWFEKLLVRVGLPAELSQAVIDWQDPDDQPTGAMGAESSYYQGLQPPYLAPNTQFHNIEELKRVRGFEGKNFDLIKPYISALPTTQSTKININTAPALVLASIDEKLDQHAIDDQLKAKFAKMEYFNSVNDLWSLDAFKNIDPDNKQRVMSLLDVKSNYFQAHIEVMLSERKRQFSSSLMRKDKQVFVYSRSLARF